MHAEHAIRLGIGENFDEALGVAHRACAPVGGERKFSDIVARAALFELFFRRAHSGDLRHRVDDARDRLVVHVACLSSDDLRNGDTFVFGLVREHRPAHDVANGVDAGHARRELRVDRHTAAIKRDAEFLESQSLCVRHASRCDEYFVRVDGLRLAARDGFEGNARGLPLHHNPGDLARHVELEALLLQHALELLADFEIHSGKDAI